MSTSNPFGKLKIERDEEDREEMAQQKKSTGEGNQLSNSRRAKEEKEGQTRKERNTIISSLTLMNYIKFTYIQIYYNKSQFNMN